MIRYYTLSLRKIYPSWRKVSRFKFWKTRNHLNLYQFIIAKVFILDFSYSRGCLCRFLVLQYSLTSFVVNLFLILNKLSYRFRSFFFHGRLQLILQNVCNFLPVMVVSFGWRFNNFSFWSHNNLKYREERVEYQVWSWAE